MLLRSSARGSLLEGLLTILETLLAGLLVDFKDLTNTQRSKHTMHSIV